MRAARALAERAMRPLSIRHRIALLVIALLVPMIALMVAAIVKLASLSRAAQYNLLQHTASVTASSVEAEIARYLAAAQALSASPSLLEDDLSAFRLQAVAVFPDISAAWPLVSNLDGQEIMNLLPLPSLPRRDADGLEAQNRAFASHSPLITGVFRSSARSDWIVTIEFPVFRDSKPYRELSIAISARRFFRLLDAQDLPEGWSAAIADTHGRYIARSAGEAGAVGQPVSEAWQATLQHRGIVRFRSPEGEGIVNANEVSALSGWTVGIAVKESVLEAPVWTTLRWAIPAGIAMSVLSLMLAIWVARRITRPIRELERKAAALVGGRPASRANGIPDVERVWVALQTAVTERQRFEQDLRLSEELLRTAAEGAQFGSIPSRAACNARPSSNGWLGFLRPRAISAKKPLSPSCIPGIASRRKSS